jgi:hypothetical protein
MYDDDRTNGGGIARTVNPGQVVGAGQDLFVVTDLSTVWAIGDLYEKDFPLVRARLERLGHGPRDESNPARPGRLHRSASRSGQPDGEDPGRSAERER